MAHSPDNAAALDPVGQAAADERDKHFRTDHLMADLKGRSVRGGAVTVAAQGAKFVLQMGSTMVLARLLTPTDFGLVAMVTVVTGFVGMFKDAGLSMATVQRETITHGQVSTLFWINVTLSVLLMALTSALAPVIAWFYGEPRLVGITLAIAGTFIFAGFTVQHQALLRRQMQFKKLAVIEVIAMATGAAVAVTVGWHTRTYWALVCIPAGTAVTNALGVWICSGWKPGPPKRGTGVMPMLKFGGGLTGFAILNYFTRNADNVIIGVTLGSAPLGIYSRAYYLLMVPIRQFNAPVGSVMVPALSRLQNDPARYRNAYLRAVGTLAFIGMPLVALLYVVADEIIAIVLGPGWGQASTVFRWIAPAAMLGTVNVAPGWLCVTLGRTRRQLVWAAISAPLTVAAFIVGTQWGVVGVAAAFSLAWCALLLLFMAMACHRSPVSLLQLLGTFTPPLLTAIAAAGVTMLLAATWVPGDFHIAFSLILKTTTYVAIFSTLAAIVPCCRARLVSVWSDVSRVMKRRGQEVIA